MGGSRVGLPSWSVAEPEFATRRCRRRRIRRRLRSGRAGRGRGASAQARRGTRAATVSLLGLRRAVDEFFLSIGPSAASRARTCSRSPIGWTPREPWRHQVAELPPIAVRVAEHRLHVRCPRCATQTRADVLAGARSAFGAQAAGGDRTSRSAIASRVDLVELARELFGVELQPGRVDAIVQRAGASLELPTSTSTDTSVSRPPSTSTRPAGGSRRQAHPARSPTSWRCYGSRPTATSASLTRCSARSSKAPAAPTAGGPTTGSRPANARSAGRT